MFSSAPVMSALQTNSSSELAVTTIYDTFLDNLDKHLYTCAIFLDIKKAFDTIDHKILLKKSYHYGFRGKLWNLLKSDLENRKMSTKIGRNTFRSMLPVCAISKLVFHKDQS